ncbi:MAG: tRNA-i(6)A37 thiotransferase enzyme MiaB [Deltaproteobacteria bacterium]|nr:tRNA-i(6)A37 thiotransferase enzyme MiaB [Deltaproteobacteria bacterium]
MLQKKVHILTYGCQMNVSDSEKIGSVLRGVGYEPSATIDDADMVILNTCSVRSKAEEKIYGILFTMKGRLKRKPNLLIGVGGCVAQQEGERLLQKVPHLNFVFGTHTLHLLPQMVRDAEAGRRVTETGFIDDDHRLDLFPQSGEVAGVTRLVTIMQGCDNFCSYCIVPYVRGREVSRRPGDILEEIRRAADSGCREVTLLGQNVNSYGLQDGAAADFASLLRGVANIDGIQRIRFMTSHPKDISTPLIDCFADLEKLCSHIHLPVQSGSDRILAMMNRGYNRADYLLMVKKLRSVRPDILFTSDIIVGFPGETEEDFQQSLSLLQEVRYSDSYSFVYSPRPETKAALLPDKTGNEEKVERFNRLLALQKKLTIEVQSPMVGKRLEVLVEGAGKKEGQMYGRTSGNRVVNFSAEAGLAGTLQQPLIVRNFQNSLLGELR